MRQIAPEGMVSNSNDIDGTWKKSSWSLANGNCVEVASLSGALVLVRDSTNPEGSVLGFAPGHWGAFVANVRKGIFAPRVR
jgi:Domain of unknown function (DUF397)